MTFRFKAQCWKVPQHDRVVTEALTGQVFFRFGGPTMHNGALWDASYAPIAYFRPSGSAFKRLLKLTADPNGRQEIMTMRSRISLRVSKIAQIRFRNLATGRECDIGMELDLPSRKMIMWPDEMATRGDQMKMPIAHIRARVDIEQNVPEMEAENEITIAPNVDVAMVIAVTLALLDRSDRVDDD